MAPEQFKKGEEPRPSCDISSLGVILYELLTRELPFSGDLPELTHQICHESPKKPSAVRGGLGAILDAICRKAMEKKPEERFASMADFAAALDGYLRRENLAREQKQKRRLREAQDQTKEERRKRERLEQELASLGQKLEARGQELAKLQAQALQDRRQREMLEQDLTKTKAEAEQAQDQAKEERRKREGQEKELARAKAKPVEAEGKSVS
jgi:serine/threonine protein kinase